VTLNVLVLPRWGATKTSDWMPWAAHHLTVPMTVADLKPSPQAPEIEPCVEEVQRLLVDPAHTVLVGHSVGCQGVMRAAARLPEGVTVAAVVLVAGWFWVDDVWEGIRPWVDTPLDDAAVRRACPRIEVLLSDDDPFTRDHRATATAFQRRLGARVTLVRGGGHFDSEQEPGVLEAIRRALGPG
jgi:predicted alpha/beta hydrolase family esterase